MSSPTVIANPYGSVLRPAGIASGVANVRGSRNPCATRSVVRPNPCANTSPITDSTPPASAERNAAPSTWLGANQQKVQQWLATA